MKFSLIVCFGLVLAFSAQAQDDQQSRDARAIGVLVQSVSLLVGSDLSCDSASDCQTIAIGSRACGGPASYMIASKKNYNFSEIVYLAEKTEEKQFQFNSTYNINSICSMAFPPIAGCRSNKCAPGLFEEM